MEPLNCWDIPLYGCIHENPCYLLRTTKKVDGLLCPLAQLQWIMFRFLNGGILKVEEDLNEGIAVLGQSTSSAKRLEHLEILGKVLRFIRSYVSKNLDGSWFQLYGRLRWHATVNEWTEKFIRNIENASSRP